jgi:phage-related minor tail protein
MGEGVDTITEDKFPRFKQALEDAGNTTLQLDNLFTNTFNSFTDTLADSIMTGKFAFKDFARSVIADIARIIARQQALIAIQKISGLFGGSLFGFNIGGLLPARSSGGRVNAGMPVTVGEAGKEIFVPQSSGTIIPNNQAGGSTNINFTINTVDAQGVDDLITNRRSTIINVINDALNRQGKEALV